MESPIAQLGRHLFHSPRLSRDGSIACASCHDVSAGGDDGHPTSTGIDGQVGHINSPSVLNRRFDFRMFWDGRAKDLMDQADGPLHHPGEMDSSWPVAITNLASDERFRALYRAAYPTAGVTASRLRAALVSYEDQLVTPDSRFDRFLCGDLGALSPEEHEGYKRFISMGCVSCHQGRNLGGNLYQRFGVFESPFDEPNRGVSDADRGRFNVTGDPEDLHVFKVPSLRNVDLTAPYFHDGSAASLEDAIRVMARAQLGRRLGEDDVARIASFLRTLTGELPEGSLQ